MRTPDDWLTDPDLYISSDLQDQRDSLALSLLADEMDDDMPGYARDALSRDMTFRTKGRSLPDYEGASYAQDVPDDTTENLTDLERKLFMKMGWLPPSDDTTENLTDLERKLFMKMGWLESGEDVTEIAAPKAERSFRQRMQDEANENFESSGMPEQTSWAQNARAGLAYQQRENESRLQAAAADAPQSRMGGLLDSYSAPRSEMPSLADRRMAELQLRDEALAAGRSGTDAVRDSLVALGGGMRNVDPKNVLASLTAPDSSLAADNRRAGQADQGALSPYLQARMGEADDRIMEAAQSGEWDSMLTALGEYMGNPSLATHIALQTLPSMLAVLGPIKAAQALGAIRGWSPALANTVAANVGGVANATLTAGDARQNAYEEIKAALIAKGFDPQEASDYAVDASLASAATGGAMGYVGGKLGPEAILAKTGPIAGLLAGRSLPTMMAARGGAALAGEVVTELGEELAPQAVTNALLQGVDGRAINQGLGKTAAQTLIGVGPMAGIGSGAAMYNTYAEAQQDLTYGMEFDTQAIDAFVRQSLSPDSAQMQEVTAKQASADAALQAIPRAETVDQAIAAAQRAIDIPTDTELDAATLIEQLEREIAAREVQPVLPAFTAPVPFEQRTPVQVGEVTSLQNEITKLRALRKPQGEMNAPQAPETPLPNLQEEAQQGTPLPDAGAAGVTPEVGTDETAALRRELATADPFTAHESNLLGRLVTSVTNDVTNKIEAGEMPVFRVGRIIVAITPSAQSQGKFQVTRYSEKGALGDSQYNSIEDAIRQEGLFESPMLSQDDAAPIMQQAATVEAEYQAKRAEIDAGTDKTATNKESLSVQPSAAPDVALAITRTQSGTLELSGFSADEVKEVAGTLPVTVRDEGDGRLVVAGKNKKGNALPISKTQEKKLRDALMGREARAPKKRKFTGNLRNDINLLAPGLYADVARGGDGESLQIDLSAVAEYLRNDGYWLPEVDTGKDSDAVIEMIRQDIANGGGTVNMQRMEQQREQDMQAQHREAVRKLARKYGIKTVARKFTAVEEDVIKMQEQRHNRAVAKLEERLRKAYDAQVARMRAFYADFPGAVEEELEMLARTYQDASALEYYRAATRYIKEMLDAAERYAQETPAATNEQRADGPATGEAGRSDEAGGRADRAGYDGSAQEFQLEQQDEADLAAQQERIDASNAAEESETRQREAAERQARIDAEIAARQGIAADNFTLDAQVNDSAAQRAADRRRADDQLAGQGDIFSQPPAAQKPVSDKTEYPTNDAQSSNASNAASKEQKSVVPNPRANFVDQITGEAVSLTDAQRDVLAKFRDREQENLAKGGATGEMKMFAFDGSIYLAVKQRDGDPWHAGLFESDGKLTGVKEGRHDALMGFGFDDRRIELTTEAEFKKDKQERERLAAEGRAQAEEEAKPRWYSYHGINSVMPRNLVKMSGKWYRIGDDNKLLRVGLRAGDWTLLDAIERNPNEWTASDPVTVVDGKIKFEEKKQSKNLLGGSVSRPVSEMSAADMLRAAADKMDAEKAQAENVGAGETANQAPEQDGKIEDFGEKLGGSRKDRAAALHDAVTRVLSDEELASQPLSKIWPKEAIDQIDDPFMAAVAHTARAEIKTKPRKGYKLSVWINEVKTLRELVGYVLGSEVGRDAFAAKLKEGSRALEHFGAKIALLESIDRANWDRIDHVAEYPQAFEYGSDGKTQIPSPFVVVEIDGQRQSYRAASVADVLDKVRDALGEAPKAKRMEFEVRGQTGSFAINKKGDKLYRKLKTFETSKEAFAAIKNDYDALVAAWEAVKDSDNVKETDVRRGENRQRTAQDWRNGRDVTPEQFQSELGFRGIEFGNWVSQGAGGKERQGMLNQAYDALMDLASIIGVPPKAMSLNGTLGLGFGSRGSGKFAAHFEPDMLVINLTKTRGAGSLAHEWFHALDNYFQSQRGKGADFITNNPENYYIHKTGQKLPARAFNRMIEGEIVEKYGTIVPRYRDRAQWTLQEGVRTEVAESFSDLVNALNESPMAKRANLIDKGKSGGYWSRIIERGARSFENYVIHKMQLKGYHNDYLANVTSIEDFARDPGRYPYLLEGEIQPVAEAFDNLFATIQTKETAAGVAMFSRAAYNEANEIPNATTGNRTLDRAELSALRREAAQIERPQDGVFLRVTEDGRAIATGPKGTRVPDTFRRFAAENDLVFTAGRIVPQYRNGMGATMASSDFITPKSEPMPIIYRESGALYFGESGATVDRTGKTRFSRGAGTLGNFTIAGNQTPAIALNRALVQYGLGPSWSNAYVSVKLPDALSGIRQEIQTAFGRNIRPVAATHSAFDQFNGIYLPSRPGDIFVNVGSDVGFVNIAGHELLHDLKRERPELYDWFAQQADQYLIGLDAYQARLNTLLQPGEKAYTPEAAKEELLGDFTGDALADPAFLAQLAEADGSRFKQLLRTVIDWLKAVGDKLRGLDSSKHVTDVEALRLHLARALLAFSSKQGIEKIKALEGPMFSKVGAGETAARAPEVRDDQGRLLAPNGQPSRLNERQWHQVRSPEFIKWFGDWINDPENASKVIDENGEPMVVYHGTKADFPRFEMGPEGGAFFTDSAANANEYAGTWPGIGQADDGNVMPSFLSIKKPYSVTDEEWQSNVGLDPHEASAAKHDGYVIAGQDGGTTYIAFKPSAINSAVGNVGAFGQRPVTADEAARFGMTEEEANAAQAEGDIRFSHSDNQNTLPLTGGQSRVAARSVITGQPINATWKAPDVPQWDNFVRTAQDKLVDTKRVLQAIKDAGTEIKDQFDPYLQEILYHGRTAKRVQMFAEKELRPLYQAMQLNGIKTSEDMQGFEDYLWAQHATERNTQIATINPNLQDGGSGLTNAEAADILAGKAVKKGERTIQLNTAKMKAYASLAARVKAITDNTLKVLVDSGLETQATIDAWQAAYQHYVPLMRDMEADSNFSGAFGLGLGTGQGYSVKGSASKRAMGSERGVVDILANIAMQRERAITRAEKNRVAMAVYGMALTAPNPEFWLPISTDMQSTAKKQQMIADLIALGVAEQDAQNIANEPRQRYIDSQTGLVSHRINPSLRNRDDVLAVRVNGKDRFVLFSSDERAQQMVRNLKNLDAEQLGYIMQNYVAPVTRYFAAINTQYNPIFGLTNFVRDTGTALLNLASTPLAGKQAQVAKHVPFALKGIYSDLRAHRSGKQPQSAWAQEFEEFQTVGGQTGYRDLFQTSKQRAEALARELRKAGKGEDAWRVFSEDHPIGGWLSDYNDAIENAWRLAAYRVAKESGMSKERAAALAKNLTVNFNKKGLASTQMAALYAFFNAAVQGTARIGETMIKDGKLTKAGQKIMLGGLTAGVMQAMMFSLAGWDDDEPPQFIREKNFIIPLGDGDYISLPYALGFHVIPNIGRVTTEFVMAGFRDPARRLTDMVNIIMDGFNPIGGSGSLTQMLSPTVVDPVLALSENRDWTDKPIYKEDFSKLKPTAGWTRAKDTASDPAIALAYGINFITGGGKYGIGSISPTPDHLDYLFGQVTGGLGREINKAYQSGKSVVTGQELPAHKRFVAGRFYGETEGQAAEVSKFYNNLRRIGEHAAALDEIKEAKDVAAWERYLKDNPDAKLVKTADRLQRKMSELQKLKRQAIASGNKESVKAIEARISTNLKEWNAGLARPKN